MINVAFCVLVISNPSWAQIQIGTLKGTVADSAGAALPGAVVTLENTITGYRSIVTADERGAFTFNNVPFDSYLLRVHSTGFQPAAQEVRMRSNVPVTLDVTLSVSGASEAMTVKAEGGLVEEDSSSTETDLDESFIKRSPGANRPNQLQRLIATTPGWFADDNGLLHIRGVDDGVVFVVDGIPTISRLDALSASGFDTEMARSMNILTGNIPAEFGGRSGAVITIQPKSGIDTPFIGSVSASFGRFHTGAASYTLGGRIKKSFGLFIAGSANRSNRFLDPPDPRNFNNRGGAVMLNLRTDWHPTMKDLFLLNVSANGTDFRVPNTLEQDLAGQRQEMRDNSQSISWQRIWSSNTVSNLAYFRRSYETRLLGSPLDTPLFAEQDRRHTQQGLIASVTHLYREHTFKAGAEGSRITPREFLTFAITDRGTAEEANISEAALAFDREHPFTFRDSRVRGQFSWYIQDTFSPVENLTVNAGLRYDHSSLFVSDQQFSPRVGVAYYIRSTKTVIRASFNRLYMPPQVENLLLADSEQARRLSPFEGGGASIRPEKVSAYEAGFSQDVSGLFKLDAAYWHRSFRNYDDPNVFFSTTIVFPNSVARGFARGVDVRVDVPEHKGWSGFISYGNSRILQEGPINGGLFLTDEFIEVGPGTKFIPDHDQRNAVAFQVMYYHTSSSLWASFSGRHQSGTPLELEDEELEGLKSAIGADLVNFERGRVKPWSIFDVSAGADLFRDKEVVVRAQLDVENLFNRRFVYNFGNPFSGTHFGHPRLLSGRIKVVFR
jgi:TonB dependent receptor-like, beta-barrel/Carboxypeptidase regulatory-like domain